MSLIDRQIQTSHADISLRDSAGSGFPVVLLHGAGASKEVFERQFESSLSSDFRLIAIDLPGHGQSSDAFDPAVTYTISGLAECLDEVLDQIGIKRAALFGWSLGGHIAVEMMASRPSVAGIMLTGAPPVPLGPIGMLRGFYFTLDTLLASKRDFTQRNAERYAQLCYGDGADPRFVRSILRADGRARTGVSASMMRGDGVDQRWAVQHARVPVAIVNGTEDPLVRLSYIAGLGIDMLWENEPVFIVDTGHAPFWEKPDVFNPILARFLHDIAAREALGLREERRRVDFFG